MKTKCFYALHEIYSGNGYCDDQYFVLIIFNVLCSILGAKIAFRYFRGKRPLWPFSAPHFHHPTTSWALCQRSLSPAPRHPGHIFKSEIENISVQFMHCPDGHAFTHCSMLRFSDIQSDTSLKASIEKFLSTKASIRSSIKCLSG